MGWTIALLSVPRASSPALIRQGMGGFTIVRMGMSGFQLHQSDEGVLLPSKVTQELGSLMLPGFLLASR
jgi:hypothetical protein